MAGRAVHAASEDELARWRGKTVGIVFQFFQLLPTLTTAENVMLPMDFANARPPQRAASPGRSSSWSGWESRDQADKLPAALSGGQQQRAAIARALANDPPLVIADEPTGNLDSQTAREVLDLLHGMTALGTTVVMATHEHDTAGHQPCARARGRPARPGWCSCRPLARAGRRPLPAYWSKAAARPPPGAHAQRLRGARDRDRDRGVRDGALELRDPRPRAEPGLPRHAPGLGRAAHGQGRRRAPGAGEEAARASATPRPAASCAGGSRPGPRNGAASRCSWSRTTATSASAASCPRRARGLRPRARS